MLNSLMEALKLCLAKDKRIEKPNECLVPVPDGEIQIPTSKIEDNAEKAGLNMDKRESGVKNISFRLKCNDPFGFQEDDSFGTLLHSPKFGVCSDIEYTNSNHTLNHLIQTELDISNPITSETEEPSKCFEKEKLADIKLRNKTLLYTAYDPEKEALTESIFCMNDIVILDSEITQAKQLTVEDLQGNLLNGNVILIDASGSINSLRKRRDGYVFFGPVVHYKNCIINDILINYSKNLCKTRLFVIFYERSQQKYFIRGINENKNKNNLIYVKVEKPFHIKQKHFFSLNKVVISVKPVKSGDDTKMSSSSTANSSICEDGANEIKVVVYVKDAVNSDDEGKTTYYFTSKDSPVPIGRSKCTINVNSNSLSKRHSALIFDKKEKLWFISDGNFNKPSLNGTWLMLTSKYELKEKTQVKIGNDIIKIEIN